MVDILWLEDTRQHNGNTVCSKDNCTNTKRNMMAIMLAIYISVLKKLPLVHHVDCSSWL